MEATTYDPAGGALPFAAGAAEITRPTEHEPVARFAKFSGF